MPLPGRRPDWATNTNYSAGPFAGQTNKATPPSGNIAEGFDPQAGLPAEWLNDQLAVEAGWINAVLDGTTTVKSIQTNVGGGGTPATPPAAGDIHAAGNVLADIDVTAIGDVDAGNDVNAAGNVTAGGNVLATEARCGHFESTSTPSVSALSDAHTVFGNSPVPTITISGTDQSGVIQIQINSNNVGLTPGTDYQIARVTFGATFGTSPPTVNVYPGDNFTADTLQRWAHFDDYSTPEQSFNLHASAIATSHFDFAMGLLPSTGSHTTPDFTPASPTGLGFTPPFILKFAYMVGA